MPFRHSSSSSGIADVPDATPTNSMNSYTSEARCAFASSSGIVLVPRRGASQICGHRRALFYAQRATLPVASQAPRREREGRPSNGARGGAFRDRAPFKRVEGAVYYTECGTCTAVYEVDPDEIGENGRRVKCSVCDNTWFQRLDRLRIVPEDKQLNDYPVEQKDELIEKRRASRAEHRSNRERNGTYNAGGGGRDMRRSSSHSVFVGNLPFNAEVDELRQLFENTVEVSSVVIVKDKATGKSKGFGFINVSSDEDVITVCRQHDGVELHGRRLSLRSGKRN